MEIEALRSLPEKGVWSENADQVYLLSNCTEHFSRVTKLGIVGCDLVSHYFEIEQVGRLGGLLKDGYALMVCGVRVPKAAHFLANPKKRDGDWSYIQPFLRVIGPLSFGLFAILSFLPVLNRRGILRSGSYVGYIQKGLSCGGGLIGHGIAATNGFVMSWRANEEAIKSKGKADDCAHQADIQMRGIKGLTDSQVITRRLSLKAEWEGLERKWLSDVREMKIARINDGLAGWKYTLDFVSGLSALCIARLGHKSVIPLMIKGLAAALGVYQTWVVTDLKADRRAANRAL